MGWVHLKSLLFAVEKEQVGTPGNLAGRDAGEVGDGKGTPELFAAPEVAPDCSKASSV